MTTQTHPVPTSSFWRPLFPHGHAVRTAAAPQSRPRYPSVQHGFVALRAVRDDLLCLASSLPAESTGAEESPRRGHRATTRKHLAPDQRLLYRAVIEAGQPELWAEGRWRARGDSLGLCRVPQQPGLSRATAHTHPALRCGALCHAVSRAGRRRGGRSAYQPLIEDHLRYVRDLATNHALLERRFYLVIPAENAPGGLAGTSRHGAELNASLSGTSATGMSVWPSGLRMLIPGARRAQRASERQASMLWSHNV